MSKRFSVVPIAAVVMAIPALAQCTCPIITCDQAPATGRQVNISGATLLRSFFSVPAGTNDFVDVDGNGCFGFDTDPQPGDPCFPNAVDQLAPANNFNRWWIIQNRAVGSVEGFTEFIDFTLCCDLPEAAVTDESRINAVLYANSGGTGGCIQDNDNDGILPNGGLGTGTPVCPCSIDIAIMDVPGGWAAQGAPGTPNWNRTPGAPGYGQYAGLSVAIPGCAGQNDGAYPSMMASLSRDCAALPLNVNRDNPDERTLYDFTFAYAPIGTLANRGTGLRDISIREMQHLWVTGRARSGENFAVGTRDAGSGTRNGFSNSIGVDPSWANGDGRGARTSSSSRTNLGSCHRVTNCGSSSHMENAVQMRRLGLGYSGLVGSTAAVADASAGAYELLNVINDITGGTVAVRPTVSSVLDNADPNTAYRIGGPATFGTRGDPFVSAPSKPDTYNPALPQAMCNEDAADYLWNIKASIDSFEAAPTSDANLLMPAQYLTTGFFLLQGLDANPSLTSPTTYVPLTPGAPPSNCAAGDVRDNNAGNPELQCVTRTSNTFGTGRPADGIVTPDFGSVNPAGLVPVRGSTYGYQSPSGVQSIAAGQALAIRNRISGDFLYDFVRNVNDIPNMMAAFAAGRDGSGVPLYTQPVATPPGGESSNPGNQSHDVIIVDVIGDYDGNGLFDAADIRYFADGLAMTTGANPHLDRAAGFCRVDQNWTVAQPGHPAGNFFNTTVVRPDGTPVAYTTGVSRFDVAGGAMIAKGDAPIGFDGVVDIEDLNYILANFGDWSELDEAKDIDLSCDMNGDLRVDNADVAALFCCAWGAPAGDINFSGAVDLTDLATLLGNFGTTSGATYGDGDLDFDGDVDLTDLASLLSNFGTIGCTGNCCN